MHKIPPEVIAASRRAKIRETLLELLIKEKKDEITISCGHEVWSVACHCDEDRKDFFEVYKIADKKMNIVNYPKED